MLTPILNALGAYKSRRKLYLLTALSCLGLVLGFQALKRSTNLIVSDGRSYYVYLPSLFVDGDLDFENQVRNHWDVDFNASLLEDKTPSGLFRNRYPIGFALTLLPAFATAHALTRIFAPEAATGYSWLYQLFCLLQILGLGIAAFMLCDKILTQYLGLNPVATGIAVVGYWMTTPFSFYYFREPFMVHIVSFFWVTLVYFLIARFRKHRGAGDLVLLIPAAALAGLCRPTNAFLGFGLLLILKPFFEQLTLRRIGALLAGVFVAIVFIVLQLWAWKEMSGLWFYYSYGSVRFHWFSPKLWQTLFSSNHGLFFWAPLLFLSVAGLFRGRALFREPLVRALAVGWLALWYFNSSWEIWNFGDAFGARAFLELSLFYIVGLTLCFQSWLARAETTKWVWLSLAVSFAFNYGLMFLYLTHRISRNQAILGF